MRLSLRRARLKRQRLEGLDPINESLFRRLRVSHLEYGEAAVALVPEREPDVDVRCDGASPLSL